MKSPLQRLIRQHVCAPLQRLYRSIDEDLDAVDAADVRPTVSARLGATA